MEERLLKLTFGKKQNFKTIFLNKYVNNGKHSGNNPPQQRSQLSNLPVEDKIKTSDDLISKLKDEVKYL